MGSSFDELADLLSEEALDKLGETMAPHVPDAWGVRIDRELTGRALGVLPHANATRDFTSDNIWNQAESAARQAISQLTDFSANPQTVFPDITNATRRVSELHRLLRDIVNQLAPVVPIVAMDIVDTAADLRAARERVVAESEQLHALRDEANDALAAAREAAARRGTTELTTQFEGLATSHASAAKRWLSALVAVALVLALLIIWLTLSLRTADTNTEVLRIAVAKAAFGGLLTYALVFASRNFRSSKHLQNEYEARTTTLQVAQALRSSVSEDAAKDTILQTAVLNAFAAPSSGLVKHRGSDDEAGLTLAALSALRTTR